MNAIEWPHLLGEHLLKSTCVLALGFILVALLRGAAPAGKHGLWLRLFTAGLALPLLLMLPRWEVLPSWTKEQAPETAAGPAFLLMENVLAAPELGDRATPTAPTAPGPPPAKSFSLSALLFGLWGAGVLALLLQSVAVGGYLRRLERSARKPGPRLAAQFDRVRLAAGLKRPATLLLSPEVRSPFAWGLARSRILLPESAERWSESDLEMVLLHELEHVRRRDARAVLVSRMFLALNWVNPLAWIAHRQSVRFREEACDEKVVSQGHDSRDYADLLLRQACSASNSVLFRCASAVVETGTVEGRVRRVLANADEAPGVPDRSGLARWVALISVGAVFAIAMLGWRSVEAQSGDGTEAIASGAAEKAEADPDCELVTSAYSVPSGFLSSGADGRRTAKEVLESVGVTFGAGSTAIYNPRASKLIVRNTRDQLELVEAYLVSLNEGTQNPQAQAPVKTTTENLATMQAAERAIEEKLTRIMLPSIEFEDLPLSAALASLEQQSADLDPSGKGVLIALLVEENSTLAGTKVTLSLKNVPLALALRHTADSAGAVHRVTEHGVEVLQHTASEDQLFEVNFSVPSVVFAFAPHGDGQKSTKETLESAGVSFREGTAATYDPATSQLTIRNTRPQLELVGAYIQSLIGAYMDSLVRNPPAPATAELAKRELEAKLKETIIPEIEFRRLPLRDALAFIQQESVKHDPTTDDPEKRGVDIILDVASDLRQAGRTRTRITLYKLTDVPLGEALRYTTSLAQMEYEVGPHAILIRPVE